MPAQHRLAKLHSLGGKYAKEAEDELRQALKQHGTTAKTAEALNVHEKSLCRWIYSWGMTRKKQRES
jgi:transcriptional regulator with PAS, ATPase and Fis domain